ncbi:MAG: hypothetical protein NVSMB29_07080 [Candidatus Dormibacteria bacterium]
MGKRWEAYHGNLRLVQHLRELGRDQRGHGDAVAEHPLIADSPTFHVRLEGDRASVPQPYVVSRQRQLNHGGKAARTRTDNGYSAHIR